MGTSLSHCKSECKLQDHPHAYGDKIIEAHAETVDTGSSPRVWGQVDFVLNGQYFRRIIPTRMGTRKKSLEDAGKDRDHPHAYGDKKCFLLILSTRTGSSPRVWGQVRKYTTKSCAQGIIPTRMGTRILRLRSAFLDGDHPHAYGDKISAVANAALKSGSSPRVWGQVEHSPASEGLFRIIPTRMGTRI